MSEVLRYISDAYEQAQKMRIATGNRIAAICNGKDDTWGSEEYRQRDTAEVLAAILRGDEMGPVPMLGRTYRRYHEEEQDLRKDMEATLAAHPAYPWLSRVKGIGPTLACKILARLDVTKADTPSAFWRYAGFSTIEGSLYRCATCHLEMGFLPTAEVSGKHKALNSTKQCTGRLEHVGPCRIADRIRKDPGYRCSECGEYRADKPDKHEEHQNAEEQVCSGEWVKIKRPYDAYMKKVMWLAVKSFKMTSRGMVGYHVFYRQAKDEAERSRPQWHQGRKEALAVRKTAKLFLSHLWQVWREAEGLPVTDPYAVRVLGHDPSHIIQPWEMVE